MKCSSYVQHCTGCIIIINIWISLSNISFSTMKGRFFRHSVLKMRLTRVAAWLGWDPRMRAVMNSDNFSMANTIRAIISNFRFFFIFCSFFSLSLSFSNSTSTQKCKILERMYSSLHAKYSLPCLYDFYEVFKHLLERILADMSWWSLTMVTYVATKS